MRIILNNIVCLPKVALLCFCTALLLLVGFFDYASGDYGVTVVYIVPIYVAAKLLSKRSCLVFCLLSIVVLVAIALATRPSYSVQFDAYIWNVMMQSTELGVVGFLVAQMTRSVKATR
jgi:hypothetical protein